MIHRSDITSGPNSREKIMTDKNREWIEAKKKYHLSDTQIQMARKLRMNPQKFGSLANHKQEKWKAPLPDFIEELYFKRFKKEKPDVIKKLQ
jgi:hypothetical protein